MTSRSVLAVFALLSLDVGVCERVYTGFLTGGFVFPSSPSIISIMSDVPKRKVNLDVIGQLEEDLEESPLDYARWTKLIKQVVNKDKEEQVRRVFEKYLLIFKHDGAQWCGYISYEMNRGEFQKVETLFGQCINLVDDVELYRLYVSYVRRTNDVITGGEKARGVVIKAFEFAVNKVGIDIASGPLWNDYLDFLKSWTPTASWEQQQKVDLIRKVYKRFLVIPTEKIEQAWSVYTKWESDLNASAASKFIAAISAEFMEARSWNTEWQNMTQKLLRRSIIPFSITDSQYGHLVRSQLDLWYKWIELERKNNLAIKEESLLQARIEYVFKQAVKCLPFVPEIWFKLGRFWSASNEDANANKVMTLLKEGLVLNPRSFLIGFELAELYEKDGNFGETKSVFEGIIDHFVKDYSSVTEKINSILDTINKPKNQPENSKNNEDDENEDEIDYNQVFNQLSEPQVLELQKLQRQLEELNKCITLLYSKLMLSAKRANGITEARSIFKQARKISYIGYGLYVENAMIEYYSDNKSTAIKILRLAMKKFGQNGEFLLAYLDYLITLNDFESIKTFFEQARTNLLKDYNTEKEDLDGMANNSNSVEKLKREAKIRSLRKCKWYLRKLTEKFARYAANNDLQMVMSLEARYSQYFPEDDPIEFFSDRYSIGSMNLIEKYDLGTARKNELDSPVEVQPHSPKRRKVQLPNIPKDFPAIANPEPQMSTPEPQAQKSFVGNNIYNLLRVLPSASYFGPPSEHVFDGSKIVELLANLPDKPN